MKPASDLLLIMESDPASVDALHRVADRLGCDRIEASSPDELIDVLSVRCPTMAVLALDRLESDGLGVLQVLARHGASPATVFLGSVNARVLGSVKRAAEAQGLHVAGSRARPLNEDELERLLSTHLNVSPPVSRAELDQAFAECEFFLRFQPKVSLGAEMRIRGVEALVRWRHPRRGELAPRHFLQSVEAHGLLSDLTDVVLTEAIRQAGVWRKRDMAMEMTANLSPRLVRDREFPERLGALLVENEVPPSQVTLDVTEAATIEDADLMLDVFTRLRILGVGLSLDNFGTGLSSLTELYRMPYSEIKVDHALLRDVVREREAEVIVRAVANLAHALELTVCAEGVETRELLDFARSAGFDSAQGRLFCGPILAGDIEKLLQRWPGCATAATGLWRALRPVSAIA